MDQQRRVGRLIAAGISLCVFSSGALRAAPPPPEKPADDAHARELAFLGEKTDRADQEIVALAQQRTVGGDPQPLLEFQIDLRVIERDLLQKAVGKEPGERVNLLLRGMELDGIATRVEDYVSRTPVELNGSKSALLKGLHDLTFHLDQVNTTHDFDELSKAAGLAILSVTGTTDPKSLPTMRPKPLPVPGPPPQPNLHPQSNGPRTLHELAEIAKNAAVSPMLHQQLLALVAIAEAPDGKNADATLLDVVNLLEGVRDLPLAAETREQIMSNLSDGVTLYIDVRTRSAGEARIKSMSALRDAVARINSLSMSKELEKSLSPALAWAAQNPKDGVGVFNAIGKYVEFTARFDAPHPAAPASVTLHKALEDLDQSFAAHRAAFVTDAGAMDLAAMPPSNPHLLEAEDDELSRILDAEALIQKITAAVETLELQKPRPAGAIERRADAAADTIATSKPNGRAEATQMLHEMINLADLAGKLKTARSGDIPGDVIEAYAGSALPRFDAKWRLFLSDEASALASGASVDKMKVARLDTAIELSEALQQGQAIQTTIAKDSALSRWIDFDMTAAQIEPIVAPYRTATASAFAAFASDDEVAIEKWTHLHQHDKPLLDTLGHAAAHADDCTALPTGLAADGATLLTPLDNEPYFATRQASVGLAMWQRFINKKELENAQATLDDLMKDMGKK